MMFVVLLMFVKCCEEVAKTREFVVLEFVAYFCGYFGVCDDVCVVLDDLEDVCVDFIVVGIV